MLPPPRSPWSTRLRAGAAGLELEHRARSGSSAAAALDAFAARLERCGVEGVAVVVDHGVDADGRWLRTALPGGRTLADAASGDPARELAVAIHLMAVAARLHRRGERLGPIGADDVRLDDHGRPVVVRLREPATTADDVAAVLALLAERAPDAVPPSLAGGAPDRLDAAAAARGLATALPSQPDPALPSHPGPPSPDPPSPEPASPPPSPQARSRSSRPDRRALAARMGRRTALGLAAAGGAVLVAAGAASLAAGPPGAPGSPPAEPAAPGTAPAPGSGADDVCAARRPTGDLATAPCPTVPPEGVLVVSGHRWLVDAPGAVWQVGDWDCDGEATLALQLPDGSVVRYDAWPGPGRETEPTTLPVEPGVVLLAAPAGTCGPLRGVDVEGGVVELGP